MIKRSTTLFINNKPFDLRRAKKLDLRSYPATLKLYQDMCRRNGITYPPEIYIESNPEPGVTAGALRELNAILIEDAQFRRYTPEEQLAFLCHETGHILDYMSETGKACELKMDSLAVKLMGSRDPLINALRKLHQYAAAFPMTAEERAEQQRTHGTIEERIANIMKTNPADRTELDAFIGVHNHNREFAQLTRGK